MSGGSHLGNSPRASRHVRTYRPTRPRPAKTADPLGPRSCHPALLDWRARGGQQQARSWLCKSSKDLTLGRGGPSCGHDQNCRRPRKCQLLGSLRHCHEEDVSLILKLRLRGCSVLWHHVVCKGNDEHVGPLLDVGLVNRLTLNGPAVGQSAQVQQHGGSRVELPTQRSPLSQTSAPTRLSANSAMRRYVRRSALLVSALQGQSPPGTRKLKWRAMRCRSSSGAGCRLAAPTNVVRVHAGTLVWLGPKATAARATTRFVVPRLGTSRRRLDAGARHRRDGLGMRQQLFVYSKRRRSLQIGLF